LSAAFSLSFAFPAVASSQVAAEAILEGNAYVGDSAMAGGTVVLHHLSSGEQGELDSLAIGSDGSFSFRLPNVPDPTRNDVFFASIRHQGVLYFGPAITTALELDSVYEIHAYDTLLAPAEGRPVALQSRTVFFEPDSADWRVTDLFQLRNDETRTIVARPGGVVWKHELPAAARDITVGEGEMAFDAARVEDGTLVVRAALPPGERIFVTRYRVDSPLIDVPNTGGAETFDVLVREPAPPLEVEGLALSGRVELEAGSTYLRFTGEGIASPVVQIVEAAAAGRPRVEWAAVVLALVLAGAAVLLLRPGSPGAIAAPPEDRHELLTQIARLDEEFDRPGLAGPEQEDYRRRRAELLRRVRSGG